jgi:Recombination endonuclease VII
MESVISLNLWNRLPRGFLRMKLRTWSRLDYRVRVLITELARDQEFKCAHCDAAHGLEIEHDHDPEHGPRKKYTIYNIRGLVCRACNWHIGMYEADQRGEYRNWPDVFPRISDSEHESYKYAYECRVRPLLEAELKERLGSRVYWRRRLFLQKFDDWREWGGKYPWYWGFGEIKDKKYGKIRSPLQFIKTLAACTQFVKRQLEKDPDYQPPEALINVLVRIKPLIEELRLIDDDNAPV